MSRFLAFDLGAESGRALVGQLSGGRLDLQPLHRFANTPRRLNGTLRWDADALWQAMRLALGRAPADLTSIGVDTWGCDYALLDADGALVEPPYHYRDHRTHGVMERVLERLGRARVYDTTGVQCLPFNTIFQLVAASERDPASLDRAAALVTIADLFNYWLTGEVACEYTNATTTQCVDARQRTWATPLLDDLGLPRRLFGRIVEPGTRLGTLQASAGGPAGVAVVTPACHDTGSAVASVATGGETVFLSSGTWSLLGVELSAPVLTPRAAALNFTNEGGVGGTTRLLKNIGGLWLLQACRTAWLGEGLDLTYDALVDAARGTAAGGPVVDPDDASLLSPVHMPQAIADYCRRTSQRVPETPGAFARTIFESLAHAYRMVLERLEEVSGLSFGTIRVIGGGARNALLNQLTANVTGRVVLAGPVEATALGNIAVQMLATGAVTSLPEARDIIRHSFPVEQFVPAESDTWSQRYRRFRDVVECSRV